MTDEEWFEMSLGRELTPKERLYLALAEIALGPLSQQVPENRRPEMLGRRRTA
jgi:hypothetical protein